MVDAISVATASAGRVANDAAMGDPTVESGECPIAASQRATLEGQMSRNAQYVQAR